MKIGFQIGAGTSNVKDRYLSHSRTGAIFGAILSQDIAFFSIQEELNYSQRGTDKTNLDYLEIPISWKYDFSNTAFTPFVGLGPYFGIKLSGNDYYKDLNIGGSFTLGMQLRIKHATLFVQGRYSNSFFNFPSPDKVSSGIAGQLMSGILLDF